MKLSILLFSLIATATSFAQNVDTTRHKAIYADINARAESMDKQGALVDGRDGEVKLTGWLDGGEVRKITASPGIMGAGFDEIYLENGQPVFVFMSYKSEAGAKMEDRVYLEDGSIVKWLSTDKTFVPHSTDAEAIGERLAVDVPNFVAALGGRASGGGGAGEGEKTTSGVFTGIDQGDYAHWKMTTRDGEELSFFILRTDEAIERVLNDPQEYEGRSCRVTWQTRKENIPEAGGVMEIDVLTGVSWE
jgi:hypothetical protein